MSSLPRFKKLLTVCVGAAGGIALYYGNNTEYFGKKYKVFAATPSSTIYVPSVKWDYNWDHRDPKSLVSPKELNEATTKGSNYNDVLKQKEPTATRHIFLIRHGQYNTGGFVDEDRYLTELGRKQADSTGKRLKKLNLPINEMIKSTMTRARETGSIISTYMPDVPVVECGLLREGAPIPPEPPLSRWKPENYQFYTDGARIEAAFRKYIHRADPKQEGDSYQLIVCHANVIRYFVCRALQLPPEAWLRLTLHHASITWISITPKGRVVMKTMGDCGHMPVELLTTS